MDTKDDSNPIDGWGPSIDFQEFLENVQKERDKERRTLRFIRVMIFLLYLLLSFCAAIAIRHIFDLSADKMLSVYDLFIFIPPIIQALTCFYEDVS